jgi:hypothetical protein
VVTWPGPALMPFARSAFAIVALGLVARVFAAQGSATPWRDAEPWMPVYGTLIDLTGLEQRRLGRDTNRQVIQQFGA